MSKPLQDYINQNLPLEGVVAWGARLPDLTLASHCYDNRLPANRVDQAVSRQRQGPRVWPGLIRRLDRVDPSYRD